MIKGKTASGFQFEIHDEAIDDMEILDGLLELDAGNIRGIQTVIVRLLGAEQKAALYEHLRDKKTGRVRATDVMAAVKEILDEAGEQSKPVKN